MSKSLGRGLPIDDKTFKPYNRAPSIYLYWRMAYTVIVPLIEVYVSMGSGERWSVKTHVLIDAIYNQFKCHQ
jgi:hypothetical protein